MNWRAHLADLYDTPTKARIVASDAGLDMSLIDWTGTMQEIWHGILREAVKSGRLTEVYRLATEQYGQPVDKPPAVKIGNRVRGIAIGNNIHQEIDD